MKSPKLKNLKNHSVLKMLLQKPVNNLSFNYNGESKKKDLKIYLYISNPLIRDREISNHDNFSNGNECVGFIA